MGMVKTAREEGEEDKRSWCVFRGDLVRDFACTVWHCVRTVAHGWITRSVRAVGIPLREDVVGYLQDVRKDRGRSSAGRGFDAAWRQYQLLWCPYFPSFDYKTEINGDESTE